MKHEGKFEGREFPARDARVETRYDALVRLDWGAVEAQILNVSSQGFRLRAAAAIEPGEEVTVEMAKLEPVKAIIRWACGVECGGVFVEAVAL